MEREISLSYKVLNLIKAIVGFALLVLFAFALNALFAGRASQTANQPHPTSQQLSPTSTIPTSQTDPTAGWKIHTDNQLGFSIKYPPSWTVHTDPATGLGYSFQSPDLQTGYGGAVKTGLYTRVNAWTKEQDPIARNSPEISLQDWFSQYLEESDEVKILSEPTDTHLAGSPALLFDRSIFLFGKTRTAVILSQNRLFMFDCFYADKEQIDSIATCERMLSTLQLLP